MKKETIRSLTKKGWSQKKIALKLHIRKSKVVAGQKKLKIGKRRVSKFWTDVESYRRTHMKSWRVATQEIKHSPYWGGKRLKKLDPNSMAYWRQKYEIERRLAGDTKKIWAEEERIHVATPQ